MELLNKKLNKRIKKIAENTQSLPKHRLSNDEWLDKQGFTKEKEFMRESYRDKFLRK